MKADTLGFLSPQGTPPEADPQLAEHLDLMHITVVPPMLKSGNEILNGTQRFPGLSRARQMLENQPNIKIVENSDDLLGLAGSHKTGLILGLQETPYDVSAQMLREFYNNGVRVITPAYQDSEHPIGSGYTNPEKPLTDTGRQFLIDCNDAGLIVDLSHLGHQTARDVLEFKEQQGLKLPILASHGGVFELFDGDKSHVNNLRNLPWDVLERVAAEKGLVGLYALTFGLSQEDNSIKPLVEQASAMTKRLGSKAVSLGTDAIYRERDIEEWKSTIEWLIGQVAKSGELEARFPDTPIELNTVGKIALIEKALDVHGLDTNEINAIAGNNAFDFFSNNLPPK